MDANLILRKHARHVLTLVAALAVAASAAFPVLAGQKPPALGQIKILKPQANRIDQVSVASENPNEVVFDVLYNYRGDHGQQVFISVVMAENGKTSPYYGYKPGRIMQGRHRTRVSLGMRQGAPSTFSTNEIRVSMYVGGGKSFIQRDFSFFKTWSRPNASLPPVLKVLLPHPTPQPPKSSGTEAGGGKPVRTILPNGHVQLRYPDGTIRELFPGGMKITHPDGTQTTALYASAQPPTPPSAPPGQDGAKWLDFESNQLLNIIRALVGNDQASVDHFLAQEGSDISLYQRVSARTQAVDMLVQP